jgi:hypothetical protein
MRPGHNQRRRTASFNLYLDWGEEASARASGWTEKA